MDRPLPDALRNTVNADVLSYLKGKSAGHRGSPVQRRETARRRAALRAKHTSSRAKPRLEPGLPISGRAELDGVGIAVPHHVSFVRAPLFLICFRFALQVLAKIVFSTLLRFAIFPLGV